MVLDLYERIVGRFSLTDEEARRLNDFFTSLTPRDQEAFAIYWGLPKQPPYAKDRLEILTAVLQWKKQNRSVHNEKI